jgi:uncharacterized membrane protein YeiH
MTLIQIFSLLGTVVFAISGALMGVRKGFDLLGVIVLGCVTALGGGAIRDTLSGTAPPLWFSDERYLWAALLGSALGFLIYRRILRFEAWLDRLDALGLALFAATGAQRGTELGFGPLSVIFIGALTAAGGGVLRDLLAGEVPKILYRANELYATAAAVGALALYLATRAGIHQDVALLVGIIATLLARVVAKSWGLTLPVRDPEKSMREPGAFSGGKRGE